MSAWPRVAWEQEQILSCASHARVCRVAWGIEGASTASATAGPKPPASRGPRYRRGWMTTPGMRGLPMVMVLRPLMVFEPDS